MAEEDDPDDDGIGGSKSKKLSDLKTGKSDTTHWIFLSDAISQKDRSIQPKIFFNVSE